MDEHTYGVAELARAVGRAVDGAFPGEVWVRGEIHNLERPPSGHVYFDLLDPDRPADAVLPVVLFDSTKRAVNIHLQRSGAGRMEDGADVRVRGFVSFYSPQGRVQLRMTRIDADYTVGQLAAARARLLQTLAGEGLIDANGKLPLPAVPLRVGLVTSAGSAAATDFISELQSSGYGWRVKLADARVQGFGAPAGLAAALAAVPDAGVDVIALVRGGGARTDLAAFDEEVVARAIATAPVPVLTGLGHEVDDTVADRVAHSAFKTPTACAAALVARVRAYVGAAEAAWEAIARRSRAASARESQAMQARSRRLVRSTSAVVAIGSARVGGGERRLHRAARHSTRAAANAMAAYRERLVGAARRASGAAARDVDAAAARARALDPALILGRGWSITRDARGSVVRSASSLTPGEAITTTLADGTVSSRVESVHHDGARNDD